MRILPRNRTDDARAAAGPDRRPGPGDEPPMPAVPSTANRSDAVVVSTSLPSPHTVRRRRYLVAVMAVVLIVALVAVGAILWSAGGDQPAIESTSAEPGTGNQAADAGNGAATSESAAAAVDPSPSSTDDATATGNSGTDDSVATDSVAAESGRAGITTTRFVDVATTRLVDTRETEAEPVSPGGSITVDPGDLVPTDGVATLVLSVNVAMAQGPGPLSVDAGGPAVTAVEVATAGQMTTNLVFVPARAGEPITVVTTGGGHLVVDAVGYFENADTAAAGRFVPVATQRLARLVTEVDGREAVVSPLSNPALPASGVASVLVRVTADVGADGGMVRLGANPESLPNSMMWAATTGDDRTRQGVAVVPLGDLDELAFTYNGGSVLDLDVLGYFTDDSALDVDAGLFVPRPGIEPVEVSVTAGEPLVLDAASVLGFDDPDAAAGVAADIAADITAVPMTVYASSDGPGQVFVGSEAGERPASATVELGSGRGFGFAAPAVDDNGTIVINSTVDVDLRLVVPGYFSG